LGGKEMLDLAYVEDSAADVDLNIVATGDGRLIEVQGTAEAEPFSREQLDRLLDLGLAGCAALTRVQQEALRGLKLLIASGNAKKVVELRRLVAQAGLSVHVCRFDRCGVVRGAG